MTVAVNHFIGMTLGLLVLAVVWYLYWHDGCPPKHTAATFLIGAAMVAMSSDLVFSVEAAAGWDIVAYALLTLVGLVLAFRGWATIEIANGTDIELESDLIQTRK